MQFAQSATRGGNHYQISTLSILKVQTGIDSGAARNFSVGWPGWPGYVIILGWQCLTRKYRGI